MIIGSVLLAYIDEIGEPGAFVSREHEKYKTSPAFGYAGLVIPESAARRLGAAFTEQKRTLFATELLDVTNPGQWERKGSSIFRPDTHERFPQQIRVFSGLVRTLRKLGGSLFYYVDEKPLGTPHQTQLDTAARETAAMRETLNRLARHADSAGSNLMVMIDQVNENQRSERLPKMYAHILGRSADFPEMKRIIEPPMHVDSQLSSNIQLADWIAACVTRAIEYQLIKDSPYRWVAATKAVDSVRGAFTHESKLHLWKRSLPDLLHSEVFRAERPLFPEASGQLMSDQVDPAIFRRMKAAAEAAATRKSRR